MSLLSIETLKPTVADQIRVGGDVKSIVVNKNTNKVYILTNDIVTVFYSHLGTTTTTTIPVGHGFFKSCPSSLLSRSRFPAQQDLCSER